MKLYYAPGACSLFSHIVLREAGIEYELVKVDLKSKQTQNGENFREVNAHGYIPTLVLDDGQRLNECLAIALYLADRVPQKKLVPEAGSFQRFRMVETLSFIATELHKGFAPLFNSACPDDWRRVVEQTLGARLNVIADELGDSPYLFGDDFTIADAYLYTVLSWCAYVELDLGKWPALQRYFKQIGARPTIVAAREREGLA